MREKKTEAVILDTSVVFDSDRLYLLFTREFGKLRARARGVRRPSSRLAGHLLPYLPCQMELVETGDFFLIVQAQLLSQYTSTGGYPENSLLFLESAARLAEALDVLFVARDPHPVIYDGLVYTLDRLRDLCATENPQAYRTEMVVVEFLVKALAELGYRPELYSCVVSGGAVESDFLGWSSQLGGLLNKEGYERERATAVRIESPKTVVALRKFSEPQFVAERLTMPDEVQKETVRLIYDYLQNQIGQPLKSLRSLQ